MMSMSSTVSMSSMRMLSSSSYFMDPKEDSVNHARDRCCNKDGNACIHNGVEKKTTSEYQKSCSGRSKNHNNYKKFKEISEELSKNASKQTKEMSTLFSKPVSTTGKCRKMSSVVFMPSKVLYNMFWMMMLFSWSIIDIFYDNTREGIESVML